MPVVTGSGDSTNLVTRDFSSDSVATSGSGDASASRLNLAGLVKGGINRVTSFFSGPNVSNVPIQVNTQNGNSQDWRVRVSVAKGSGVLYDAPDSGIMKELVGTNGVIFPYTPNLTIQHTARYTTQNLTHTNYSNHFYEGSEVQAIQITADFTVQNLAEAKYFLAAVYFFRAATKMFYGNSGQYQGAPPPIVYLDGYGAHYLPHVSCVVTGFSHTMPSDVDYIATTVKLTDPGQLATLSNQTPMTKATNADSLRAAINAGGTQTGTYSSPATAINDYTTRVPTASQFTITLQPVYSRSSQRQFNYESFARGELITGKPGYL